MIPHWYRSRGRWGKEKRAPHCAWEGKPRGQIPPKWSTSEKKLDWETAQRSWWRQHKNKLCAHREPGWTTPGSKEQRGGPKAQEAVVRAAVSQKTSKAISQEYWEVPEDRKTSAASSNSRTIHCDSGWRTGAAVSQEAPSAPAGNLLNLVLQTQSEMPRTEI